jgi:tetratricopeptide (TPR) repeat protein
MKRALAIAALLMMLTGPVHAGTAADAEAALDRDDHALAFSLYSRAVQEAGADPAARASALYDRAEAYVRHADDDQALADYGEALSLSSDTTFKAVVLTQRGDLYTQERKYPEAVADYTRALALKPDLVGVLTARGQAHLRLKETDAAVADFDAELKASPRYPRALRARAQALGQPDPIPVQEHPW